MDASRIAAAQVATPPLAAGATSLSAPASGAKVPFSDHIKAALQEANSALQTAEARATEVAKDEGDIVETMTALAQAELSLRHVVTLRNRMLEAYQQVMRLQL